MKNFCENVQAVFHIADKYTKTHLPFQIFVNREFKFLITSGGAFVDNKNEYIKFSSVLNTIGEEIRNYIRSSFWIDFIEFLYFWSKSELGNLLM